METLFERYRSRGDVAALGTVFDRAAPELFRIAVHLARDPAAAEELVQETFLTAIEQRDRFDASRRLVPWLTGILSNHARRARRAKGRTPDARRLDVGEGMEDAGPAGEITGEVARAIERLEPPYREVVLLHLRHGMAPAEIALALDRAPGTVRAQLSRGLEKLRGTLPRGVLAGLVPAAPAAPALQGLDAIRTSVMTKATTAVATAAATTTTTLVLGGLVVKKTWITAAAALVVLAFGAGGVAYVLDDRDVEPHGGDVEVVDADAPDEAKGPALVARGTDAEAVVVTPPPVVYPKGPRPEGAWSLYGVVYAPGGTTLEGVRIETLFHRGDVPIRLPVTTTDAEGHYRVPLDAIRGLDPAVLRIGGLSVTATADGYQAPVHDLDHAPLDPAGDHVRLDLQMGRGTTVHGRVLGAGGRPVAGARVCADVTRDVELRDGSTQRDAYRHEATTDDRGHYSLRLSPFKQSFTLSARGDDGIAVADAVTVEDARRIDAPDLRLAAAHVVEGRVVGLDGRGVPDVPLRASHPQGKADEKSLSSWLLGHRTQTRTRADGSFTLPVHRPGTVRIDVRTLEGWGTSKTVEAGTRDVVLQVDLRIVRVRALGPDGEPMPGAKVGFGLGQPDAHARFEAWVRGDRPMEVGVEHFHRHAQETARGEDAVVLHAMSPRHPLILTLSADGCVPDLAYLPPAAAGRVDEVTLRLGRKPKAKGSLLVNLTLDGVEVPPHQMVAVLRTPQGMHTGLGIASGDGTMAGIPVGRHRLSVFPGPQAEARFKGAVPANVDVVVREGERAEVIASSHYYGEFAVTFRRSDKPEATHQAKVMLMVKRDDDALAPWSPITGWTWRGQHYGTWSATQLGQELRMIRKLPPGAYTLRVIVEGTLVRTVPLGITSRGLAKLEIDLASDR